MDGDFEAEGNFPLIQHPEIFLGIYSVIWSIMFKFLGLLCGSLLENNFETNFDHTLCYDFVFLMLQ